MYMAYLNSSEDVSTVLDVLRIKLCIRSCRLWLFWELQTHCQLQRFLRSRYPLISGSVLTWLAVIQQKAGICIDLEEERERERERGRSGDCSVVERYSRACAAVQGRIV